MVCPRCIAAVTQIFASMNIAVQHVKLGEAETAQPLSPAQKADLSNRLKAQGFELLEESGQRTVEAVKNIIVDLIYQNDARIPDSNLSALISNSLNRDYKTISTLFKQLQGQTIERYFIAQKIERVKELISYNELSLSEISYKLNYSSVAHLSAQFKRETGMTPSDFKNCSAHTRRGIDKI